MIHALYRKPLCCSANRRQPRANGGGQTRPPVRRSLTSTPRERLLPAGIQMIGYTLTHQIKEVIRPYYLRWLYFPFLDGARPEYFRSCWQNPNRKLDKAAELLGDHEGASKGSDCAVIFYPMNDWHTRIQRSQQLARALASLGHPIVYVNPHLGRQFESVRLFDRQHRVSYLEEGIVELHVRLPREPVFHHRMLRDTESRIVADAVTRLAETAGWKRAVQIVSLPIWMEASRQLRGHLGWPIVYDCHDLLAGLPNMSPALVGAERDVMGDSDLVLYSSHSLMKDHELSGVRTKSLLLRNAVEGQSTQPGTPHEEAPSSRWVAGYVGAIGPWFDTEAVLRAAQGNPEFDFVLAGRVENPEVWRLKKLPNVSLLGEVPHADLRQLLARFRIGLIPFLLNDLTRATNPIKLYEYFSFGLPVVSTRLPEVEAFSQEVYLCSEPAEFASQVRRAMLEEDEDRRRRRKRIAETETWLARAKALTGEFPEIFSLSGRYD
jgi:glycosyltransferase involved in cell wall biosynthesis